MVIRYSPEVTLELLEADLEEMLKSLPESKKEGFLRGLKKIVRNLGKAKEIQVKQEGGKEGRERKEGKEDERYQSRFQPTSNR